MILPKHTQCDVNYISKKAGEKNESILDYLGGSLIQWQVSYERQKSRPTHREEGHWVMETEVGVMWPPAKEHLEPPEARRGRGGFFC